MRLHRNRLRRQVNRLSRRDHQRQSSASLASATLCTPGPRCPQQGVLRNATGQKRASSETSPRSCRGVTSQSSLPSVQEANARRHFRPQRISLRFVAPQICSDTIRKGTVKLGVLASIATPLPSSQTLQQRAQLVPVHVGHVSPPGPKQCTPGWEKGYSAAGASLS